MKLINKEALTGVSNIFIDRFSLRVWDEVGREKWNNSKLQIRDKVRDRVSNQIKNLVY